MDSDWAASIKEINGIDLANYLPQRRSYNSVVYIHKKYFQEHKRKNENTDSKKVKKPKRNNLDKSHQFNADKNIDLAKERVNNIPYKNENSVLEQTIKFAKNIVPLVLPPGEDKSQVFYTIKTTKKRKTQDKRRQDSSFEPHEPNNDREESKKIIETYRKVKKESISVKESFSHSSNNTLDDLNINQSLCCTLSEVSEKKYHKKGSNTRKPNQGQKISISESFEAVATNKAAGEGNIKIHLMNEKDKEFLSDSIKDPVLKALGEFITELQNTNSNIELSAMQNFIKSNSQKLDNILDKLTCIENKLEDLNKNNNTFKATIDVHGKKIALYEKKLDSYGFNRDSCEKNAKSLETKPDNKKENKRISPTKLSESKLRVPVSTLENLAEDVIEIKEDYSSEEELHHEILDRRSKSTIVEELEQEGNSPENLGGGEVLHSAKGVSLVGTKLERPKRLPARFCWTDAGKSN